MILCLTGSFFPISRAEACSAMLRRGFSASGNVPLIGPNNVSKKVGIAIPVPGLKSPGGHSESAFFWISGNDKFA